MKIEMTQNKGSKWMIVAVGSSTLKSKISCNRNGSKQNKNKYHQPDQPRYKFCFLKESF